MPLSPCVAELSDSYKLGQFPSLIVGHFSHQAEQSLTIFYSQLTLTSSTFLDIIV